jgi:hypothetical protein
MKTSNLEKDRILLTAAKASWDGWAPHNHLDGSDEVNIMAEFYSWTRILNPIGIEHQD